MLQFASLSFDASVEEVFLTLTHGATLVLRTDAWLTGAEQFWSLCEAYQISVMDLPTQFWAQLAQEPVSAAQSVRVIFFGGDAVSAAACQAWFASTGYRPRLLNGYGPTEATIASTFHEMTADDNHWRTIGRPLANTRVYVLDSSMQPVPLGAAGELYIGGVGVARGYLNRPELTIERFLPDPFSEDEDARMYKTGDLVRYLPNGNLEFLGRNDHQVKIRGFRIELGEIEARLTEHPQVREAVVLALSKGGDKRLVAYVVAEADEQLAHGLRAHLSARLPDYMMPAAFVRLEALPLTPNGKLDRRALPAPSEEAFVRQTYEMPRGEIEVMLANIWIGLLKVEKISRHDNFFTLGGHSLLAMLMVSRIRNTFGIEISLRTLFEAPTIAGLAQRLLKSDGARADLFDVLFPIKSEGGRPPLFCVHHVGGLSWSYIGLSQHLDMDQPVYGLQARGFDGVSPLAQTIDVMVSDYINQIRRIQPHGPYYLLGWSFGGSIAHSMAAQLEQQGEKVALLALLDTCLTYSELEGSAEELKAIRNEFIASSGDENISNEEKHFWENTLKVYQNNDHLAKTFSPLTYGEDLLFFRATIPQGESSLLVSPDVWRPHVLGNIKVHDIHCTHEEMDEPAPAAEIGRILAQKLDELQKQHLPQSEEEPLI
jgi:thioesterase domain-containing protein/acyl carrier protein